MAAITLYPVVPALIGSAPAPSFWHGITDTMGTTGVSTLAGWTVTASTSNGKYAMMRAMATVAATSATTSQLGAISVPTPGTSATTTTTGQAFRSEFPYKGTVAAGTWTANMVLKGSVATAINVTVRVRIWRSVNENGSSGTELTSGAITASSSTLNSTAQTISPSVSLGSITLDNEYLFFAVELLVNTATVSATVLIQSNTNFVTPNFTSAQKIFWLTNTTPATPGFFGALQEDGTPPSQALSTTIITVGKTAVATIAYWRWIAGATNTATGGTSSQIDSRSGPLAGTSGTAGGDAYRTPTALTGTFTGTWQIAMVWWMSSVSMTGQFRCRVAKSANADGSSATYLTASTLVSPLTANSSQSSNLDAGVIGNQAVMKWQPASAITLSNEYLFFEIEWQETVAGSANGSGLKMLLGSAAIFAPNLVTATVYTLPIDQASLGLTSQTVTVNRIRTLPIAQASLALTPQTITPRRYKNLSVAMASLLLNSTTLSSGGITADFTSATTLPSWLAYTKTLTGGHFFGTMFDKGGRLTICPNNILQHSDDFTATGWLPNSLAITVNDAVAPDGTTTACKLTTTDGTVGSGWQVLDNAVPGGDWLEPGRYVRSVYVKAGNTNFVNLIGVSFDLRNTNNEPTVSTGYNDTLTASGNNIGFIEDAGNGWRRLSVVSVYSNWTSISALGLVVQTGFNTGANYTNNVGLYVWVWHPLCEKVTSEDKARAYLENTTGNYLFGPRFDHKWSGLTQAAATWSTTDKGSDIALSNGNLTATISTAGSEVIRANRAINAGEFFEVKFGTVANTPNATMVGLANASQSLTTFFGSNGVGWANNGQSYGPSWTGTSGASSWGSNDTVGVFYTGTAVRFYKNGTFMFERVGAAVPAGPLYPAISLGNSGEAGTINTTGPFYGLPTDAVPMDNGWVGSGLRQEEQSASIIYPSEDFNADYWTSPGWSKSSSTTVVKGYPGPAGGVDASGGGGTASFLKEDTLAFDKSISHGAPGSAGTYTCSLFAKAATRRYLTIANSGGRACYDLQTGTVAQKDSAVTARLIDCGNGWYRLIHTYTVTTADYITISLSNTATPSGSWDQYGRVNYTGDGVSGLYIFGFMCKAGIFATNYIQSYERQHTVYGDGLATAGAADTILTGTAATAVVETDDLQFDTGGNTRILVNSTGSNIPIMLTGDNGGIAMHNGSAELDASLPSGTYGARTIHRAAAAWTGSAASIVGDGGTVAHSSSFTFAGAAGAYLLPTNYVAGGLLRKVTFYASCLSDTALQSTSVIGAPFGPTFDVKVVASRKLPIAQASLALNAQVFTLTKSSAPRTITIDMVSLSLTPQTVTPLLTRKMNVAQASLALNTQAITVKASRKIAITQASLALNTQTVSPKVARKIAIAQAALALNTQTLSAVAARKLAIAQASLALNTQTITPLFTRRLTIAQASLALNAQTVSAIAARKLAIAQASLAITTEPVIVKASRKLAIAQASLALNVQTISPLFTRKVNVTTANLVLNTQNVVPAAARKIVIAQGTLSLNGQTVTLSKRFILTVAQASLALTTQTVNVPASRKLSVAQASLALTTQSVVAKASRKLAIAQASLALNTQSVVAAAARKLAIAQSSLVLTAETITPVRTRSFVVGQASVALTSFPVVAKASRKLSVAQSSLALSGQLMSLAAARKLSVAQTSLSLTNEPLSPLFTRRINVAQASLALTSEPLTLRYTRAFKVNTVTLTLTPQDILGTGQHVITISTLMLGLTSEPVATVAARKLPVAQASLTLTSEPLTAAAARKFSVGQASLTLTPETVIVKAARKLAIAQASLALTTETISPRFTRNLAVAQVSLAITPRTVVAKAARVLKIDTGTLTLTLQDLPLGGQRSISIAMLALQITPETVAPRVSRAMAVATAHIDLTNEALALRVSRQLTVAPAALSLSSPDINAGRRFTLAINPASVSLSPALVALAINRAFKIDAASLNLGSRPIILSRALQLAVEGTSLQLSAEDLGFSYTRNILISTANLHFFLEPLTLQWVARYAPPVHAHLTLKGGPVLTTTLKPGPQADATFAVAPHATATLKPGPQAAATFKVSPNADAEFTPVVTQD
jgi:hypothetical protein